MGTSLRETVSRIRKWPTEAVCRLLLSQLLLISVSNAIKVAALLIGGAWIMLVKENERLSAEVTDGVDKMLWGKQWWELHGKELLQASVESVKSTRLICKAS
jgi:hypothetical protein